MEAVFGFAFERSSLGGTFSHFAQKNRGQKLRHSELSGKGNVHRCITMRTLQAPIGTQKGADRADLGSDRKQNCLLRVPFAGSAVSQSCSDSGGIIHSDRAWTT